MKSTKRLGIWMDHTDAHVMEFSSTTIKTKIITSKFTHQEKIDSLKKSERLMHNKEQHEQSQYYHELAELIKNYSEVILFGPTDAKTELYNILRADPLFSAIKIEIKDADHMTENEQHSFVRNYFLKA